MVIPQTMLQKVMFYFAKRVSEIDKADDKTPLFISGVVDNVSQRLGMLNCARYIRPKTFLYLLINVVV